MLLHTFQPYPLVFKRFPMVKVILTIVALSLAKKFPHRVGIEKDGFGAALTFGAVNIGLFPLKFLLPVCFICPGGRCVL